MDIKKYEGFSKDLFARIAELCDNFDYETVVLAKTYPYGEENKQSKAWNGIIGLLVGKKADFAIGDITITQARKSAIDFSISFQTLGKYFPFSYLTTITTCFICENNFYWFRFRLGVSILFGKPHKEVAGLFSFMDPLSADVWMYMATAFLCISIVEWLLAKIAAIDWENPHPVRI